MDWFDKKVESLEGDDEIKAAMKEGYRQFVSFISKCETLVPDNYYELDQEEHWAIQCKLGQGVIESSKMILQFCQDVTVEDTFRWLQSTHSDWTQVHGVWVKRRSGEKGN